MKGEKMLIGLSYIDRKFIDESENDTVSGKKRPNRRRIFL